MTTAWLVWIDSASNSVFAWHAIFTVVDSSHILRNIQLAFRPCMSAEMCICNRSPETFKHQFRPFELEFRFRRPSTLHASWNVWDDSSQGRIGQIWTLHAKPWQVMTARKNHSHDNSWLLMIARENPSHVPPNLVSTLKTNQTWKTCVILQCQKEGLIWSTIEMARFREWTKQLADFGLL